MVITLRADVFSSKVMGCSCTANIKMHYVKLWWRRKEKYSATNLNEIRLILKATQLSYKEKK